MLDVEAVSSSTVSMCKFSLNGGSKSDVLEISSKISCVNCSQAILQCHTMAGQATPGQGLKHITNATINVHDLIHLMLAQMKLLGNFDLPLLLLLEIAYVQMIFILYLVLRNPIRLICSSLRPFLQSNVS